MKIAIVGNCQHFGLAACIRLMIPDAEVVGMYGTDPSPPLTNSDLVLLQSNYAHLLDNADYWDGVPRSAIKLIPPFVYSAFHPDIVYAAIGDAWLQSALGDYNSALVLYGWMKDLSPGETVRLFCDPVYRRLQYYEYEAASRQTLFELGDRCQFDLRPLLDEWRMRGCFAHSINHPKLFVLSSIARVALSQCGLKPAVSRPEDYLPDLLGDAVKWPVYPEIAARLGVSGSYEFTIRYPELPPDHPVARFDLEQFVERSFDRYAQYPKDSIVVERFVSQRDLYRDLELLVAKPRRKRENPYSNLPDYCFWQRGVANIAPSALDPVVAPKFRIARTDGISTAGSCFAQHIAKTLIAADYNYFVAEPAPDGMPAEAAAARGYGLFSARFGNVYSARQLLQLFQRAYGEFSPRDIAWRRDDGRFVDPFRPQIEPDGFADPDAVAASRKTHFAAVRRMFEQSALFVFTVGLTEVWTAKSDGAVFPVAPGVVSGALDRNDYQFVNFKVSEIVADLNAFIGRLRGVNRDIRLLFTVSPVPLVATYEDRHVLVSTTYSKSAIRAAVEEVVRQYDFTDYFPSYEIITGWYNKGRYFDTDLRSVTPEGVAHVMRLFSAHYLQSAPGPADAADRHAAALKQEIAHVATIICDEELLGRGRSAATPGPLKTPKVEKSLYANAFAEPDAGRGGIDAPDWIGERLPADGGDTRIGPFAARIREMEVQLLALREALARETASRESEVLRVTEQTAEQARQTAALRTMVGDTVDLIGVLRTENDHLRERLDQIADGVKTWLLPTLEGHAAAIRRGRHPLRKLGRRAVRATGFFLGLRRS